MSDLIREYIKNFLSISDKNQLIEASSSMSPKDAALLSSQKLGWAAEWAVYVALGGSDSMISDGRIAGPYGEASRSAKNTFNNIYKRMISAAKVAAKGVDLGTALPDLPPGAGNRPVDVETTSADIHVKYNDFKRLLGFQKQKDEEDDTDVEKEALPVGAGSKKFITPDEGFNNASAAYDASLSEFFETIQDKANVIYKKLSPTSRAYLTSPRYKSLRATHMSGPRLSGRKTAKSYGEESAEYADFLELRKAYQEAVKIVGRSTFYEILEQNGFKEKLLNDIENLIFKSKNKILLNTGKTGKTAKTIVFAKFKGPDSKTGDFSSEVTCKYYNYSSLLGIGAGKRLSDRMAVVEFAGSTSPGNTNALAGAAQKDAAKKSKKLEKDALLANEIDDSKGMTTIFYQVVDVNDPKKVYFQIEFRLDGDSHPPQLKTGRDIMNLMPGKK